MCEMRLKRNSSILLKHKESSKIKIWGKSFQRAGGTFQGAGGTFQGAGGTFQGAGGTFQEARGTFQEAGGTFQGAGGNPNKQILICKTLIHIYKNVHVQCSTLYRMQKCRLVDIKEWD